jgi:hypothetical protein
MQIHSVPLTPENLWMCAPLWGGREAYSGNELERVLDGAALLLYEHRALGAIILEDGHPRAFGLTSFCDETFIDEYLNDAHPHIGRRLLRAAHEPGSTSVLQLDQIGERNAGKGVQLVVLNTGYDTTARDSDMVLARVMAAFMETHRGYRIARIVNEVFGEAAMAVVQRSGSYEVLRTWELPVPGGKLGSLVATLTREQAAASRNALLAIFAYSPPRLFFTASEQQLLSEALAGFTDDTLSRRLGIPLSAVKARWNRIQDRTLRMEPELFRDVPLPRHRGRGVQTRHLILQYVRSHPSELTPYAVPRTALRAARELTSVRSS